MSFKRRAFLQASGAMGLAMMGCGPDSTLLTGQDLEPGDELAIDEAELTSTFTLDPQAFPLGVMAGDVLPRKAVLWTKFDMNTLQPLRLRVYRVMPDGKHQRVHGSPIEETEISDAGFVHVDIDELEPNTPYVYRFLVDPGAQNKAYRVSPLGRFRTALAPGSTRNR